MDTRRTLRRELKESRDALRVMTEDRNRHRSLAATHLSSLTRVAEQFDHADEEVTRLRRALQAAKPRSEQAAADDSKQLRGRLTRALRACARYRVDAATQDAVMRRLTEQLFDALGYDDVLRARLSPDPAAALVGEAAR
jgi:chromosome segregation ATPase